MTRRLALISEHASPIAVIGSVDSGGQNIYVGQLARHLAQLGWEVDIFTRRDNPRLPEVAEWIPGVRLIHVPAGPACIIRKEDLWPHMGTFAQYMIEFARRQTYDVVHANFWMSAFVGCELKEALGLPLAVTFHALGHVRRLHQREADEFPMDRLAVEERAVRDADVILAECPQDERDLLQHYNADRARIRLVPCGFDPHEFWPIGKALARASLGFDPSERLLLQLGRLVPRKGIDNAIRGLGRLVHDRGVHARLLVVGGATNEPDPIRNPEIARLRAVAKSEDVEERVVFVGGRPRDMLKYYYSAADVFITTPWYEPFGITPLEAMACGTPVVCSSVGGLKYSVRHGQTGFAVRPNDPEALAERLASLYESPGLWQRLRDNAIRHVHASFTWSYVATLADQIFTELHQRAQIFPVPLFENHRQATLVSPAYD